MLPQSVFVRLEEITCGDCGITFAMPAHKLEEMRKNAGTFWCPNGHTRGWQVTEAQRLKKELDATRARLEEEKATTLRMQKSAIAMRAQTTRLRNRIANGVCPCCNRSFVNLGRHMGTKHPDYKAQDIG